MSSNTFNMRLLFLFLLEIDVVAHVLRYAFLGRPGGLVHAHLAFAAPALPFRKRRAGIPLPESALLPEAFAELLLHLSADLMDTPAEDQHQHDCQYYDSHKKIQDK